MGALIAMHVILARYLSPTGYGIFSFSISSATILSMGTTLGWPAALLRLIPQYEVKKQWGLFRGAIVRSHQTSLVLAFTLSVVLFLISIYKMGNPERSFALFYAALMIPILSLAALRRSMFQGNHNAKGSIIPDEVLTPLLVFLGVALFHVSNPEAALQVYYSALLVTLIVAAIWLWTLLPSKVKEVKAEYQTREWLEMSLPLFFGGVSQIAMNQSGVILLGLYGNMEDVGLYSVAFRVSILITFVMTSVNVIGTPVIATLFYGEDRNRLRSVVKKARYWSFIGAMPIFVVILIMPETVLGIFGEKYVAGSALLQIIALGYMVNAATGLSGSVLTVSGNERYFASTTTFVSIACIVLTIAVIPTWGVLGVASVYSVSIAVLNLIQLHKTHKLLSYHA